MDAANNRGGAVKKREDTPHGGKTELSRIIAGKRN